MTKYKVGNRVRIRKDLEANTEYDGCCFCPGMNKYIGKMMTITGIRSKNRYTMNGKNCSYSWTSEMFERCDITDWKSEIE